jgi:hypothetical protein
MANANPQAQKIPLTFQRRNDVPQPIMAAITAPLFQTHRTGGQINVIMYYEDVLWCNLVIFT